MDMDIDYPPETTHVSPRDQIVAKLSQTGVPEEYLRNLQSGLVKLVMGNVSSIPLLVQTILPSDEEVADFQKRSEAGSEKGTGVPTIEDRLCETMIWLQWLMFRDEPSAVLKYLAELDADHRGVCGAVWGRNDIAYKCRTCEQDPTCAICGPCFANGNHKDHDYSTIYTGGGCCDCGDVTAWKREGFCSRHRGPEHIQPLPQEIQHSVEPVVDALFLFWRDKLMLADSIYQERKESDDAAASAKFATDLTFVVVEMLLEFCKESESLLSFVSTRLFSCTGLLNVLLKMERFSNSRVVKRLHQLLLKLLAEPSFKFEFAKAYLKYYPIAVSEAVKECNNGAFKDFAAISTFSVQIFTVASLTARLVKEMNLLSTLFGCLEEIFLSAASEDGRLQVSKWQSLYDTTIRVAEDIRYVMSHDVVPRFILCTQPNLLKTWMKLLAFVQGMNPQKRETGIHVEEEMDNTHIPFVLCYSVADINSLMVNGAFSDAPEQANDSSGISACEKHTDNCDSLRQSDWRLSNESPAYCAVGPSTTGSKASIADCAANIQVQIPASATWLLFECLKAIELWLLADGSCEACPVLPSQGSTTVFKNFSVWKKTFQKITEGKYIFDRLSSLDNHQVEHSLQQNNDLSMDVGSGRESQLEVELKGDGSDHVPTTSFNDSCGREDCAKEHDRLHILTSFDWPNITYDVSSEEISIHLPLHHLLALLLQKAFRRCYGESTFSIPYQLSATHFNFFERILGQCNPLGFSAFIMEHPLRIRVFVAEVHAGMWKKNGEAALLTCEWYRTVRWSEAGLELDLFMLQLCAALAPPDLFVNRILERFGLSEYLSLNQLQMRKYEPVLVREMLILIIQIVKERRFCGLTDAESLRRELIYKLVTGDATRSQIVKFLPHNLAKSARIQEVLDTVASYSHPKGFNQGMYSLRWPCWKELDLYHPRWNSRDLQAAEERYARFCSISALIAQVPQWTNIYAPLSTISGVATCRVTLQIIRAVLFYAVFSDNKSRAPDTVLIPALHLLSIALDICAQLRYSNDKSNDAGAPVPILAFAAEEIENGLPFRVGKLSLLSLLVLLMKLHKKENVESPRDTDSFDLSPLFVSLLKKFAALDSCIMTKLQQLAPELFNHDTAASTDVGSSLPDSDSDRRKAKARQRQAAIMAKMKAEQSKFLASLDPPDDALSSVQEAGHSFANLLVNEPEESTDDVCSLCHDSNSKIPLSFLILLQKSRLTSFIDRVVPSWDKFQVQNAEEHQVHVVENKGNDQSGSTSSANDLEVISSSQLLQLVEHAVNKFAYAGQPAEVNAFLEFFMARFPSLRDIQLPFISNDKRANDGCRFGTLEQDMYNSVKAKLTYNSQLLQSLEEDPKALSGEGECVDAASVLVGKYIACLSQDKAESPSASEQVRRDDVIEVAAEPVSSREGFGPVDCDGIYLSSCGHAVHQGCLDRYLSSLKERYTRRIVFEGGHIVDLDQGEFLCPVCRRLANCVLPSVAAMHPPTSCNQNSTSSSNLGLLPLVGGSDTTSLELPQALCLLQSAAALVKRGDIFNAISLQNDSTLKSRLESTYGMLSKMYSSKKREKSVSARTSCSSILWDSLRYSIISTEISARSGRTGFTPDMSVSSLYKEFASTGKFILSLLLKIAQSSRTGSTLDVLQRFWGVKLFAESVSGISYAYPSDTEGKGGNVLCILKDAEKEGSCIDIQFWKRAAEPVLTHDPFSSLIWTLFCLPAPFLFCKDSFISLVHVFYAVSIAQAIITYLGNNGSSEKQVGDRDSSGCLINDIREMMKDFACANKYLRSNHIDSSRGITHVVRSLTFPFLRRCALLQKLLNSSTHAPFLDKDNELYATSHVDYDMDGHVAMDELGDVPELENLFRIPSFSNVVKDQNLRSLVRRWFHHFSKEVPRLSRVFYCSPAFPFKLIQLPYLYQDLLLRYIKQQCSSCNSVIAEPTLCLLCGRLCSPNWKPCCRESGCYNHANECAAGTGVFLMIKKTSILLQRASRQAAWPSPYLDAFGEEDNEMRRGKPLYLNEERYAALTYMVASHGLDRSTKVLRQALLML